jgi:hypothetical protein
MSKALIVIIVLALIGQYVSVRNTLVTKNEAVKAAWSQVDIVLQRRADLIPNLVSNRQRIRAAGADRLRRHRQRALALLSAGTPTDKIAANGNWTAPRPPAGHLRKLSSAEVERELPEVAGRTRRHRKPHRGRTQALQRHLAGLQHLRPEIPQQHLCRMGGFQTQRGLLSRLPKDRAQVPKVKT